MKNKKKIKVPAGFPTLEEIRKTYGISKKDFDKIIRDVKNFLKNHQEDKKLQKVLLEISKFY